VQQPDNFHFYSFGITQLKFSIVENAIFVTNIQKKNSNLISVESYDNGKHTTVNAFYIKTICFKKCVNCVFLQVISR